MRWSYVCGVVALSVAGASGQAPQLPDVLARAAKHVASLETSLAAVVVDEEYVQSAETSKSIGGSSLGVGGGVGNAMVEGHTVREKRTSRSELLLVRGPATPLLWAGVRTPLEIDGKATGNEAGTLERLPAEPAALAKQWSALQEVSRRVHLGVFPRNVHTAWTTMALLRADQQPRVSFKKDGEEKVGGVATWKVAFVEERTPALLKSSGGVPVPARGVIWIDPQDGRVLRTKLELGTGLSMDQMRVEVEYALDAGLGVPVPVSMRERYDSPSGKIDCKTTFSNYRRVAGK